MCCELFKLQLGLSTSRTHWSKAGRDASQQELSRIAPTSQRQKPLLHCIQEVWRNHPGLCDAWSQRPNQRERKQLVQCFQCFVPKALDVNLGGKGLIEASNSFDCRKYMTWSILKWCTMWCTSSWWRCRNPQPLQRVVLVYMSKTSKKHISDIAWNICHTHCHQCQCRFLLGGKARVSDITAFVSTIGASSMQVLRILRHFGIHFSATAITFSASALRNLLEFSKWGLNMIAASEASDLI